MPSFDNIQETIISTMEGTLPQKLKPSITSESVKKEVSGSMAQIIEKKQTSRQRSQARIKGILKTMSNFTEELLSAKYQCHGEIQLDRKRHQTLMVTVSCFFEIVKLM